MLQCLYVSGIGKCRDSDAVNHDNCEMKCCSFQKLEVHLKGEKRPDVENHQRLEETFEGYDLTRNKGRQGLFIRGGMGT